MEQPHVKADIDTRIARIQAVLTPDLLKSDWAAKSEQDNPLKGHCYVAAEVLYHQLGGKNAGWTPQRLNHESFPEGLARGETHWYLRHESGIIADPTGAQFAPHDVPHDKGKGAGFLTREPSHRARVVMERINAQSHERGRIAP